MPIKWIDTHAHLHLIKTKSYPEIIQLAKENNIFSIINVATDIASYEENKKNIFPGIHLSIGIYPSYCNLNLDKMKKKIVDYLEKDSIVAIGECGIDYYRDYGPNQIPLFKYQVQLAKDYQKPLIIHIRNAFEEVYQILSKSGFRHHENNGIIHCYTGNSDYMKKFIDLGFYISFSGIVTFKKSSELQKVALETPINRLLIETDSPYLTPIPFRGKENHPGLVSYIGKFLANLKEISIDKLSAQIFQNTCSVFQISQSEKLTDLGK